MASSDAAPLALDRGASSRSVPRDFAAVPVRDRESRSSSMGPMVASDDIGPGKGRLGQGAEGVDRVISAFVSWAHTHSSWSPRRAEQWHQTVLDFATALRQIGGVDATLTCGTARVTTTGAHSGSRASGRTTSSCSRSAAPTATRWEETASPLEGAGAAPEANALKSIFDRDRDEFRRRVKVILLAVPPSMTSDGARLEYRALPRRDFRSAGTYGPPAFAVRQASGAQATARSSAGALPPSSVADVSPECAQDLIAVAIGAPARLRLTSGARSPAARLLHLDVAVSGAEPRRAAAPRSMQATYPASGPDLVIRPGGEGVERTHLVGRRREQCRHGGTGSLAAVAQWRPSRSGGS
jgi:hypothetical protein